ncbi:MAG: hypothetical protein OJJ54_24610 [Pseudonocardia sp.]|nr:hypothetical protein [Pseudonocardia sp.]
MSATPRKPAARKPAARKPAARKPAARTKPAARKGSSARRTTTRRRTTTPRRRTSTSSTLGTAVGAAIAGVLAAAVGGLPWWGWVVLIVVGLVAGLGYAVLRGRAAAGDPSVDDAPAEPGSPHPSS